MVKGFFKDLFGKFHFYQILGCIVLDSLPGHPEFLIAGKHDKHRFLFSVQLTAGLDKIKSVHDRHFDIRKNNVRHVLFHEKESFLAVSRRTRNLQIHIQGFYHRSYSDNCQRLVIHDKYFIHLSFFLRSVL